MSETPDVDVPVPSQPDYVALDATRRAPPTGPPVAGDRTRAAPVRDVLPTTCAQPRPATSRQPCARVIAEGWSVREGDDRLAAGASRRHHDPRPGSHLAAVPAGRARRAQHPVPRRVELARLRDPSRPRPADGAARGERPDQRDAPRRRAAHTAARLRRRRPLPLQGRARRSLDHHRGPARHRSCGRSGARTGIAYLRSLYEDRVWCSPSELLDRIARDRRALELGFGEGRPRDVWRRLRFVIDQARAWSDATGGSLREYLHWVEMQSAEGSRVAEAILPETDDDAVRIMTIHAAKGLEFPITIVSGMSTSAGRQIRPGRGRVPTVGPRRRTASVVTSKPRSGRNGSRSTSRWASTNASDCCTSRARVPVTTSSCRCTVPSARSPAESERPHQRGAADRRHGRRCSTTFPMPSSTATMRSTCPRRRRRRRSRHWRSGPPSGRRRWHVEPGRLPLPQPRSPTRACTTRRPSSPRACRSARATSTCRRG